MSYNPEGILDRTSRTADGLESKPPAVKWRKAESHFGLRGRLTVLLVVAGVVGILAIGFAPADKTSATPIREGGNCGGCHPYRTTSFLTVSFSPAISGGIYQPSTTYTITITLADSNGATGENSFDLILSASGGSLATTDPNAEINSATEASANDGVPTMSASTWTVQWTSPSSGTVTMNTWAVMSGTATGNSAPYDRITTTLGPSALPEFGVLLLPIVGLAAAVTVVSILRKKRPA